VGLKRTKGSCGKTFDGFEASKADNIHIVSGSSQIIVCTDYCLGDYCLGQTITGALVYE
jgi:hypothetical protein